MELPRVTKKMQNMIKPLGLLFGFLRNGVTVQIWLFENTDLCIEGKIIGFDEYMNLVLDDAVEVSVKRNARRPIGRIMLKGDNLALVRNTGH